MGTFYDRAIITVLVLAIISFGCITLIPQPHKCTLTTESSSIPLPEPAP